MIRRRFVAMTCAVLGAMMILSPARGGDLAEMVQIERRL